MKLGRDKTTLQVLRARMGNGQEISGRDMPVAGAAGGTTFMKYAG
jgi:hypothetical protein